MATERLRELDATRWREVFQLMREQDFPHVPERYELALPTLALVRLLAVEDDGRIRVLFVVGPADDGIAFLDVVCAREAEGLWASKGVMRELAERLFRQWGLRCVWVEARRKKGLKAALQAGFVAATGLDVESPVLVMTPQAAARFMY